MDHLSDAELDERSNVRVVNLDLGGVHPLVTPEPLGGPPVVATGVGVSPVFAGSVDEHHQGNTCGHCVDR